MANFSSLAMTTLAALLLLVAASNVASLVKAVEYHSFLATPLSPHLHTAPSLDEDVFGGSLAVAEEEAAASDSAVHFRVVHRDTFAVNAITGELLKHRLQRDKRRAARISEAAAAGGGNGKRGVAAPVVSGLAQGSGEYFTKIGVGTPATQALMVLDTGSDVVWVQCAPCRRCYEQSGPVLKVPAVLRAVRVVKVPTVSMHFAGGAEAALPLENYLIPVDSRGTFCFAFAGTDGGVSIIGNIQQKGFRVVFDGDGQRVGFAPKGC